MKITNTPIKEISVLLSDCYKFGHRTLYPEGTTYVYSTLTPRENSYFPWSKTMTAFGYEMFVQKWLIEHFNTNFFDLDVESVIEDYEYVVGSVLGEENASSDHIRKLHSLGNLPIRIKALPEGVQVPMKVPVLTIENTHPDFAWLTNFLETLLISETFVTSTVSSMARQFRIICEKYAEKTADDNGYIAYQCHDFSERGQHGNYASQLSGISHLTSFVGSDTIQSGILAHNYYNADLAGGKTLASVLASEHSVMQAFGKDEKNTFLTLLKRHPKGILSLVSDTYDYYGILTNVLTDPEVKEAIMARDGKLVLRPDSGIPTEIIAGSPHVANMKRMGLPTGELTPEDKGTLELLWEIFGGTINSKGYKVLDSHIGLLYGEGITIDSATEIFDAMEEKGFSAENIVFGVGAFVYSVNVSRDSFGQAVKSQMVTINGEDKMIFKDPKTDTTHLKRSLKGRVAVFDKEGTLTAVDGLPKGYEHAEDLLEVIFENGERKRYTDFEDIREVIAKSVFEERV